MVCVYVTAQAGAGGGRRLRAFLHGRCISLSCACVVSMSVRDDSSARAAADDLAIQLAQDEYEQMLEAGKDIAAMMRQPVPRALEPGTRLSNTDVSGGAASGSADLTVSMVRPVATPVRTSVAPTAPTPPIPDIEAEAPPIPAPQSEKRRRILVNITLF